LREIVAANVDRVRERDDGEKANPAWEKASAARGKANDAWEKVNLVWEKVNLVWEKASAAAGKANLVEGTENAHLFGETWIACPGRLSGPLGTSTSGEERENGSHVEGGKSGGLSLDWVRD